MVDADRSGACRGHLGVAEDRRPLSESQIGGDDDRGLLVEPADQVEQELAAGLRERQIAELVENEEVEPGEAIGGTALAAGAGFGLKLVDQVNRSMEAATGTRADAGAGNGDRKMALSGAGTADQHGIALMLEESASGKITH